jgi:hypothetical protein
MFEMVANTNEPTNEIVNKKITSIYNISGSKKHQMPFGVMKKT